jgi:SAM-dependent methyltransferase
MEDLAGREYLRQRLEPRPGDPHYIVLSDLLIAIRTLIPSRVSRILDYGSGGSPYLPLFENCVYHRADLTGHGLDFEYGSDARLPLSAGGYDCVLSTQVLEHVENPTAYLSECHRVLKSGGYLLLTTHGMFEDHACPYDYWRWTGFGLQKIVEEAGLKVQVLKKVTTGPRAALFLAEQHFHHFWSNPVGFYARTLSAGVRAIQRLGARRLHAMSDVNFQRNRVVDANQPGHEAYIVIALLANRK